MIIGFPADMPEAIFWAAVVLAVAWIWKDKKR